MNASAHHLDSDSATLCSVQMTAVESQSGWSLAEWLALAVALIALAAACWRLCRRSPGASLYRKTVGDSLMTSPGKSFDLFPLEQRAKRRGVIRIESDSGYGLLTRPAA